MFKIKSGNFSLNKKKTSGITVVKGTARQVSFYFFYDVGFWCQV